MWREHGAQNHRAIIGVACAALLVFMVLVGKRPISSAMARLDAGSQLVIYLSPFAEDARGEQLAAQLRARDGVVASEFVGRAETRQRLLQAFAGNEAVVRELEASALPASIELQFAPGLVDVMPASPLPAQLRALPEVAELTFVGRDDHALAPVLAVLRVLGGYLAWLLLAMALVLGVTVLRMSTGDMRREASVIELLGGPRRMWRLPTMLVGGLQGFAGAGFGLVAGYWIYRGLMSAMVAAYPALIDHVAIAYVPWHQALGVLAAFTCLGMVVSGWAVARAQVSEPLPSTTGEDAEPCRPVVSRRYGASPARGQDVGEREWS